MALLVGRSAGEAGEAKEYLMQCRLRQPYYGYWGCISGPVHWGESIEAAAQRELRKQTGLEADVAVHGFYRQMDCRAGSGDLLEDKLFAVVEAVNLKGELSNAWTKGHNEWVTIDQLRAQERYFASTLAFIEQLEPGEAYAYGRTEYSPENY